MLVSIRFFWQIFWFSAIFLILTLGLKFSSQLGLLDAFLLYLPDQYQKVIAQKDIIQLLWNISIFLCVFTGIIFLQQLKHYGLNFGSRPEIRDGQIIFRKRTMKIVDILRFLYCQNTGYLAFSSKTGQKLRFGYAESDSFKDNLLNILDQLGLKVYVYRYQKRIVRSRIFLIRWFCYSVYQHTFKQYRESMIGLFLRKPHVFLAIIVWMIILVNIFSWPSWYFFITLLIEIIVELIIIFIEAIFFRGKKLVTPEIIDDYIVLSTSLVIGHPDISHLFYIPDLKKIIRHKNKYYPDKISLVDRFDQQLEFYTPDAALLEADLLSILQNKQAKIQFEEQTKSKAQIIHLVSFS